MPSTIMVGFDGSPASTAAVDWAVTRAQRLGCEVSLVQSLLEVWGPGTPTPAEAAFESAARALDVERARISAMLPQATIHATMRQGEAAEVLADCSAGAAMVVVGRDKPGGAHGEGFGAVVLPLVLRSDCTVAIIPRIATPGTGVVVGVDGTAEAERALRVAAGEAELLRQALTIVHVITPTVPEVPRNQSGWQRRDAEAEAAGENVLAAAASIVSARHPRLAVRRVLDTRNSAAETLAAAAEGAALLVVGSRGREGARHMNPGAIGSLVLARIACPMMVTNGAVGDRLPGR